MSRTQVTPSMITQICQEIRDIKTGAQDSITLADPQASSTSELGTLPSNNPDQERNDERGDSYGIGTSCNTLPVHPPKYNPDTPARHDEGPPQADQCNPGMLVAPRLSHDPPASSERNDVSAFAALEGILRLGPLPLVRRSILLPTPLQNCPPLGL